MSIANLSVSGMFDAATRDQASFDRIFALANLKAVPLAPSNDPNLSQRQRLTAQNMLVRPDCSADFVVRVLQSGNAATDTLVDLMLPLLAGTPSQLGVTFPAQSSRHVSLEAWATGDSFATTEFAHILLEETILGGATPQVALDILGATAGTNKIATNIAGARAAGFTSGVSIQFGTPGAGSLPVTITNEAAAESTSWIVKIRLGRLIAFNAGT